MASYETAGKCDDWHTPRYIFDALGVEFDLDVAAPVTGPRYVPAESWFSDGALSRTWFGFVWMNPPFGHQATKRAWLSKFFEHGDGIALVPDRTSAPWWQEFAPQAGLVLFVSPKIKFEHEDGSIGESPGTGTVLLASGVKGTSALMRASSQGLGTLFIPFEVGHPEKRRAS